MKVKIIDYTGSHEQCQLKTFDLAWRYEQGIYQLAKYPTRTCLFNRNDEERFMSGKEVWIHKDEVSIKIA